MLYRSSAFALACLVMPACTPEPTPAEVFFERVSQYCGNAFEGQLVSSDEVDADFATAHIVMHVRDCSEDEIRIPLHVGDNRSRTWIITMIDDGDGLRLKHDHRHEDGHADEVSMYGGNSSAASTNSSFAFPVDEFSKTMFDDASIPDSKQNTWVMEVDDADDLFAYQMSRPNRMFRIEFDLSTPVETPPPAWGHE